MATTPSTVKDQITCGICKSTFKSPLQLLCKHTFCLECVSTVVIDGTITCPQCNQTCTKLQCQQDTNAQNLIELFDSCTDDTGKKSRQNSTKMLKFKFPSRFGSKKENISGAEKVKERKNSAPSFVPMRTENIQNDKNNDSSPILIRSRERKSISSSSTSSNESTQKELCHICMKNSIKYSCMKCMFKSCEACRINYPLMCKDGTKDHIFVEGDFFTLNDTQETQDYEVEINHNSILETETDSYIDNKDKKVDDKKHNDKDENNHLPRPVDIVITHESNVHNNKCLNILTSASPDQEYTETKSKRVNFKGIKEKATESSSDSEFKPKFRDSLALTTDKKSELENIIGEVAQIEKVTQKQKDVLNNYHQYMKDVKVAGFDLIGQSEQIIIDRITQFYANIRMEYQSGFNEMTSQSQQIYNNMEDKLLKIHGNVAILEEIVENNDTRLMLDEEFISVKCGELDNDVTNIGQDIVSCKQAGLSEIGQWDDESKVQFEKKMNIRILSAIEAEMKQKLVPDITQSIQKMKPVSSEASCKNQEKRKKIFECTLC